MTIATDMHLIPRWDKKPGMDLARSRRKNGTGTFERYIAAQCVDDGSRLVLGVLHVGAIEDVPDFVRCLIAVCRSVDCNIRAVLPDREFFSTCVFEAFEKRLIELGIKQILAGLRHSQTSGKLERFHRTIEEEIWHYDGLDDYVEYCNTDRLYFSLDLSNYETPLMAFHKRKTADEIRHQNPMASDLSDREFWQNVT